MHGMSTPPHPLPLPPRSSLSPSPRQVLGTPVEAIMATEDRDIFNQKLAGEDNLAQSNSYHTV